MKNVSVKVRDMAKPMLALLLVDTVILAAWTGSVSLQAKWLNTRYRCCPARDGLP